MKMSQGALNSPYELHQAHLHQVFSKPPYGFCEDPGALWSNKGLCKVPQSFMKQLCKVLCDAVLQGDLQRPRTWRSFAKTMIMPGHHKALEALWLYNVPRVKPQFPKTVLVRNWIKCTDMHTNISTIVCVVLALDSSIALESAHGVGLGNQFPKKLLLVIKGKCRSAQKS